MMANNDVFIVIVDDSDRRLRNFTLVMINCNDKRNAIGTIVMKANNAIFLTTQTPNSRLRWLVLEQ